MGARVAPNQPPTGCGMMGTIEDMDRVGHACLVPDSTDHLWEATARWLAGGLAAGERVVYFENDTADAVLGRLADDRVPVRDALDDGQLVIVPGDLTRSAYGLPVDNIVELLLGQIAEVEAEGLPGVRLSGESGGMLLRGVDRVVDLELAIDRMLCEHPTAHVLCRLDRRFFDDAAVATMRAVHETELVTPAVYDDTLLRVTTCGPSALRLAGEVDHSNRPQIRRVLESALDAAVRSHFAPTDITLDLSSLRFLDVAGAVELVHVAEAFPDTHRLVLAGVRPRVVRVLDRCGAPFAPRLTVLAREGGA